MDISHEEYPLRTDVRPPAEQSHGPLSKYQNKKNVIYKLNKRALEEYEWRAVVVEKLLTNATIFNQFKLTLGVIFIKSVFMAFVVS